MSNIQRIVAYKRNEKDLIVFGAQVKAMICQLNIYLTQNFRESMKTDSHQCEKKNHNFQK